MKLNKNKIGAHKMNHKKKSKFNAILNICYCHIIIKLYKYKIMSLSKHVDTCYKLMMYFHFVKCLHI